MYLNLLWTHRWFTGTVHRSIYVPLFPIVVPNLVIFTWSFLKAWVSHLRSPTTIHRWPSLVLFYIFFELFFYLATWTSFLQNNTQDLIKITTKRLLDTHNSYVKCIINVMKWRHMNTINLNLSFVLKRHTITLKDTFTEIYIFKVYKITWLLIPNLSCLSASLRSRTRQANLYGSLYDTNSPCNRSFFHFYSRQGTNIIITQLLASHQKKSSFLIQWLWI